MGILDSIGSYLGDEENRLNLAHGFAGMSGNPNAAGIQAGLRQRMAGLSDDRRLKSAKELEDAKSERMISQALQLIGSEYPEITAAIKGGFLSPSDGVTEVRKLRAAAGGKERRITEAADGFKYYDDATRVFPNAEKPDTGNAGTALMKNFDFFKSLGKTDDEALTLATTKVTKDGNFQSVGEIEVDKAYAKDYLLWTSSGGADMSGQLAQVGSVLTDLESGVPLTGPMVGALGQWGNFALSVFNPKAANAKEQVQEVVQRNLRIILGAQFTAKEGELLISRAYNEALPPAQNAARLRKLITAMQAGFEQRNAMSTYYEQNKTLSGFKGKQPSVDAMYEAMSGYVQGQVIDTMDSNGKTLRFRYLGGDHKKSSNWEQL